MAQHDGHDIGALLADVASAFAVHVLELQPVFLQLEKAAVDIEQVGRTQMGLMDQFRSAWRKTFSRWTGGIG